MFKLCPLVHRKCTLSLRYRSFCVGIIVTSVTWAIALYLYYSLSSGMSHHGTIISSNQLDVIIRNNDRHNMQRVAMKQPRERTENGMEEYEANHINALPDESRWNRRTGNSNLAPEIRKSAPGAIDELGLIKSPSDQRVREDGYRKHAFNLLISNRLSYHRPIPDVRHALCRNQVFHNDLPSASIIICFYNEAKTALLRTVHSILDRTRKELLHEIILVNDRSDVASLHEELEAYLKNWTTKVILLQTERREGLIRARMFGARKATGKVLVFLDSHCEVNQDWLDPLLERIAENRTNVVCPIIDIINTDTFAYSPSPLVRGGFNWGLHFKWDSLPPGTFATKEDFVKPIMSPTMAGGLFAIDRAYFTELGEYDDGMDIWGGENLEISFRIWMCGGRLEIIPCSRVGHIFRKRRPYGSPNGDDTMLRNSLRVAHVWLDEYKEYFFQTRSEINDQDYGDISQRLALRRQLQCKSFDWYLKNIYPELKPPLPKEEQQKLHANVIARYDKIRPWKKRAQKYIGQFLIQLSGTNLCLQAEEDATSKGSLLLLKKCRKIKTQAWFESEKHEFLLAELLCMDAGEEYPRLAKCHDMGGPQEWKYSSKDNAALYNLAAGQCLGVRNRKEGEYARMEICNRSGPTTWQLVNWRETEGKSDM